MAISIREAASWQRRHPVARLSAVFAIALVALITPVAGAEVTFIHMGDVQHVQIQAKHHSKQGIWTVVQFATGKQIAYYTQTDGKGFWQAEFKVPGDTISQYNPQAVVTFQLWKGESSAQAFKTFTVIH